MKNVGTTIVTNVGGILGAVTKELSTSDTRLEIFGAQARTQLDQNMQHANHVGGIIGFANVNNLNVIDIDSYFSLIHGNTTTHQGIGGIIGRASIIHSFKALRILSEGEINVASNGSSYIGGLFGELIGQNNQVIIRNSMLRNFSLTTNRDAIAGGMIGGVTLNGCPSGSVSCQWDNKFYRLQNVNFNRDLNFIINMGVHTAPAHLTIYDVYAEGVINGAANNLTNFYNETCNGACSSKFFTSQIIQLNRSRAGNIYEPFLIESGTQWNEIAGSPFLEQASFRVDGDLNLDNLSLGVSDSNPFRGTIVGKGKLTLTRPLIKFAGNWDSGVIIGSYEEPLQIVNSTIAGNGIIERLNKGRVSIKAHNIILNAVPSSQNVGGLVAVLQEGIIEASSFKGEINLRDVANVFSVGGLVGRYLGNFSPGLYDNYVEVKITGKELSANKDYRFIGFLLQEVNVDFERDNNRGILVP